MANLRTYPTGTKFAIGDRSIERCQLDRFGAKTLDWTLIASPICLLDLHQHSLARVAPNAIKK